MDDNILKNLAAQLGLQVEQVQAGIGAVLRILGEQASRADFQQLLNAIPEAGTWMAQATATAAQTGGSLLGQAAQLVGGLTGSAGLADAVAALGKSGIGPDMVGRFVPAVLAMLQAQAGADLIERLVAPVPFLRDALGGGATAFADVLSNVFGRRTV